MEALAELQQALTANEADAETLHSQLDEHEVALVIAERERATIISEFARVTAVSPAMASTPIATRQTATPTGGSNICLRTTARKPMHAPISVVVAYSSPSHSCSHTPPARRGSGGYLSETTEPSERGE